jgi:hypothetical protein
MERTGEIIIYYDIIAITVTVISDIHVVLSIIICGSSIGPPPHPVLHTLCDIARMHIVMPIT